MDLTPDNHRVQPDPVMRRLLGLPTQIAVAYLVCALALAAAVKWRGIAGLETPPWLWAAWVVLVSPLLVSGVWRATQWRRRWVRSPHRRERR
jgi:hypothetical protein